MSKKLIDTIQQIFEEQYQIQPNPADLTLQKTKKEFAGDYTFVVFPFVKTLRKAPPVLADEIGKQLMERIPEMVAEYNVVQGFLNISLQNFYWFQFLEEKNKDGVSLSFPTDNEVVVIEYSSPNTNKPLHLGHVRNNLLGAATANILSAVGKKVYRVNLVNDRGIHICKSMLAWEKFGNNSTPESTGIKGDHFVGDYYVEFDQQLKREIAEQMQRGVTEEDAIKCAPLLIQSQKMLKKWEEGDPEVRALWKKMNQWVYDGFEATYARMGIEFEKTYYESDTYLLGKKMVEKGVADGVFYRKEDGSVWADLTEEGLDEKLLLRADGTSVYMTQDLGTAQLRYDDFHPNRMIYVVGNEQNYHFDVLKLIATNKLKQSWGETIYHLSYGMVELPEGKMKSREGTVVDADDLMEEMHQEAKRSTEELGKNNLDEDQKEGLYEMIGIGALKYFILKVDPKKNMLFNPAESIDFNGNTGPFIQYTHARIKSLLRKAAQEEIDLSRDIDKNTPLEEAERGLIKIIKEYESVVQNAAHQLSPALVANYLFELSKEFNRFYQESPIFKATDPAIRVLRLQIAKLCASTIQAGMGLLGIQVPEQM
ncbi:MAG TPA: arginine--tRNA ligase [Bacteroidales bacterium]|nr:arginine--tRNA ligase [Bacteroidales bacterium]HOH22973.1 arginine--tRNA ligase [Bacteroidales bacterium]HPZ03636.1 arginine--tRNA ligase [Bacteroidales bacterium]HQB75237.1 arginine--tRNA ligase [Bacteroidales bacterium]